MKQGERSFLKALYETYGDILFTMCIRIVKERSRAEDVLQESLVKIWKNAAKFDRRKARLLTWAVQIVKNTALDQVRSKAAKMQNITETMNDKPVKAEYGVSEQKVEHIGLRTIIEEKLEPRDRTIIDLLYFQGYSQKEVAKKLEMPLGSVKTRVRLTVNQLRNHLSA